MVMMMLMMMMMMMVTTSSLTTTTTTTTIALKGADRDFYSLLTAPLTVSNAYAQVAMVQSCAYHVQHIELLLRATCRVPHSAKGQLSC